MELGVFRGSMCFVAGKEGNMAWQLIGQGPFYQEWWFMGLMIVFLVGLVGLFLYLRNQREED